MVVIYNEVNFFPPTINSILLLAEKFKRVLVLEVINEGHVNEGFPKNVIIHSVNRGTQSFRTRLKTFTDFTKAYNRIRKKEKPQLILLYDSVPIITFWLSQWINKTGEVYWYHNHDVIEKKIVRPFSLLFFAYFLERKVLSHLDIFTIPSAERMALYNLNCFKGIRQVLPNYPSIRLFSEVASPHAAADELILIYQGSISEGHGIEEILKLFPCRINNKSLKLRLIGFINPPYDAKLKAIIESHKLQEQVSILDKVSYQKLPFITRQCHIGLAIYTKKDVMNSTLGTASNKIYEYTAIGLPFLYFNNPHFIEYLGKMEWALPTDLTNASLLQALQKIDNEYDRLSQLARSEFISGRNYEEVFIPVMESAVGLVPFKANRN
jgi:hypothetical protein